MRSGAGFSKRLESELPARQKWPSEKTAWFFCARQKIDWRSSTGLRKTQPSFTCGPFFRAVVVPVFAALRVRVRIVGNIFFFLAIPSREIFHFRSVIKFFCWLNSCGKCDGTRRWRTKTMLIRVSPIIDAGCRSPEFNFIYDSRK